jgi:hypothetical protein
MIYRYRNYYKLVPLENNMIGNYKSSDYQKKLLIEETKRDLLKTFLDLQSIQLDMFIGKLLDSDKTA